MGLRVCTGNEGVILMAVVSILAGAVVCGVLGSCVYVGYATDCGSL